MTSKLWWHGPELLQNTNLEPIEIDTSDLNSNESFSIETKINTLHIQITIDKPAIQNIIDINRYSSLRKLLTVTAYVLRFVNNLKKKYTTKITLCYHLQNIVQQKNFGY